MTCSGRATGHGGLQTTLVDRVLLNLDRGSDIEADQRASPTQSSAGSTSAGTAPTSSKTARDPPGSSCPWPLSFPAKENQQMSTTPAPHHAVALKTGLAALLALATALTAWRPDWIEALGLGNPDGGSGALEAAILVVLGIATAITATWAWRAWARLMSMNA